MTLLSLSLCFSVSLFLCLSLKVGDGATDMQAKAPGAADAFIGFGGARALQANMGGPRLPSTPPGTTQGIYMQGGMEESTPPFRCKHEGPRCTKTCRAVWTHLVRVLYVCVRVRASVCVLCLTLP